MSKQVDTNGFWKIEHNPISKVGVFPYLGSQISDECEPNKIYHVFRSAETLKASVPTWDNPPKPFIDDHEMLGEGFTNVDDRPVQGIIYNPVFDEETGILYADMAIYSEEMKEKIANGKKEISLGYFCKYRKESGVYNGEVYDFVQVDMAGNHGALVDAGRCGSDVKVFDQKCAMDKMVLGGEFKEEDHPRAKNGEFTSGGSGGGESSEPATKTEKSEKNESNTKTEKNDTKFETVKETKKALLLKKDNKTFWIQKRWMRADGTLTPAGEKAYNESPTDEEKEAEKAERARLWKEGQPVPKPDWENEKAYGFDIELEFPNLEKSRRERVFIPKSVMQENGNIPHWILNKKRAELDIMYRNRGGYYISKSPFNAGALSRSWLMGNDEE